MQTNGYVRQLRQLLAIAGLASAEVAALVGLRPAAARAWRRLPHLGGWLATAGCDRALAQLAAAALWLAALWLALGLVTALTAALPGRAGRLGAAACRAVLPHAARKLLAGTAGLSVLLTPIAAFAAPTTAAAPGAVAAGTQHGRHRSLPAPIWPTTPTARQRTTHRHGAATAASKGDDQAQPTVRVRRGDCLWLLAAHRLPAKAGNRQIADYWPRWYAANRQVIGPDPALLHPGEVLHVPAPPAPSSH